MANRNVQMQNSQAEEQRINHNGFSSPPPLTQLLPPVLVVAIVVATALLVQLTVETSLMMGILYSAEVVLFLAVTLLWYLCTSIVPTDSLQLRQLGAARRGEKFDTTGLQFYCHVCKLYTNKNTFHCRRCHRCVQFFDHHCKWLNNCIGAKNYFEFYALLIALQLLLVFCLAVAVVGLVRSDQSEGYEIRGLSIGVIVVGTVPFLWLWYLIGLHSYLIVTKRSTIQLIMENRNKNKIHPQSPPSISPSLQLEDSNNETDHALVRKVIPLRLPPLRRKLDPQY